MKTLIKSFVIVSALGITALPLSASFAADGAAPAKPAKEVSCKQEAKNKGIKDKNEKQAYIKSCEQKRKAAATK